MRRRLFNVAAAVSSVLCVATIALWARSYWRAYCIERSSYVGEIGDGEFSKLYFQSAWGRLLMKKDVMEFQEWDELPRGWYTDAPRWSVYSAAPSRSKRVPNSSSIRQALGFAFGEDVGPKLRVAGGKWLTKRVRVTSIPHWFAAAIFAIPPLYAWAKRKPAEGHCSACGYDLRATPHRCPECGTVPTPR